MADEVELLPPESERISLREAARMFDPPASKKALESLVERGRLQVWREPPTAERPDRASRVVTTYEALQVYASSPTARRRLRPKGERSMATSDRTMEGYGSYPQLLPPVGSVDPLGAVGRDLYELRGQLSELWSLVERVQADLTELRVLVEQSLDRDGVR